VQRWRLVIATNASSQRKGDVRATSAGTETRTTPSNDEKDALEARLLKHEKVIGDMHDRLQEASAYLVILHAQGVGGQLTAVCPTKQAPATTWHGSPACKSKSG
jgi:hypothetical protein